MSSFVATILAYWRWSLTTPYWVKMRIIGIALEVFQSYLFRVSWVASDKLQNFIIQFELYYLSSGRLREVRNKRTFSSKKWSRSLKRGSRNGRFDCIKISEHILSHKINKWFICSFKKIYFKQKKNEQCPHVKLPSTQLE